MVEWTGITTALLRAWQPIKAFGMWLADAVRAPGRLRVLQDASKREAAQRDVFRPSMPAYGIRWARSRIEPFNEPHCELCFQDTGRLVPLAAFGKPQENRGFRCQHATHTKIHPLFWITHEEYRKCRSMLIPGPAERT